MNKYIFLTAFMTWAVPMSMRGGQSSDKWVQLIDAFQAEQNEQIFELPAVEVQAVAKMPKQEKKPLGSLYSAVRSTMQRLRCHSDRTAYGQNPLERAIADKNYHRVKHLLESGADYTKDLSVPLLQALALNDVTLVRLVVAAGGKLDLPSVMNNAILLRHIIPQQESLRDKKDHRVIKFLIQHGLDSNKLGAEPDPAYRHRFSWHIEPTLAEFLVKNGANIFLNGAVLVKDNWGQAIAWRETLKQKYAQKKQLPQKGHIECAVVNAAVNLPKDLAGVIADYAVLNWREYVTQNRMRNVARGQALVRAGVRNCIIEDRPTYDGLDSDDEKSDE